MKIQSNLIQIAIKLGLLGALMNCIALVLLFYIGRHPLLLNPVLDARWPLYGLFIFFALQSFKESNNGILHFWQGLVLGGLVYLLMAQMAAAFIAVFASVNGTHFLADYITIATEQLNANKAALMELNISEQTIAEQLAKLPHTTATNLAFDYFLKSMPIGLILTLLLSVILRKTKTN